jgi:hypothetical protein
MNISGEQIIEFVAKQVGIGKMDLLRKSLSQFLDSQIKFLKSELFELKGKYKVETPEEFEKLYKTGAIKEEDTWKDYQKFDNLTYKIEKLERLNEGMNKIEELILEKV